jgi:uncharacterized protein YjiS (DUF1127 family)
MTAPIHHHAATAFLFRPMPSALIEAMNGIRGVARRIDAWLEARERAAADRDILARMSDRELLDIGLDRASAAAVADGSRMRDYPY